VDGEYSEQEQLDEKRSLTIYQNKNTQMEA
jgi:hypothetical protein